MDEIRVTILTASYNRAKLLPTIYKSLQRQTDQCFEWIIVDDGSQDDTALVVKAMQESHKVEGFPITYLHKENGGKHTAINLALRLPEEYLPWCLIAMMNFRKTQYILYGLILNK